MIHSTVNIVIKFLFAWLPLNPDFFGDFSPFHPQDF